MAKSDLRAWAVKGAEQRLVEIAGEARWIFSAFPELRVPGRGFDVGDDAGAQGRAKAAPQPRRARRARRRLSAAARKALSARMTKYWAERRKKK